MAYVSKELNFTVNDRLSLNIDGCEDLWLDVDISGLKNNYAFAAIYRHPWNNHSTFLEALDSNMQALNSKGNKAMLRGDININLDSDINVPHLADYSHIIQGNAFLSLIDQPIRITVINHILTNDSVSTLTPGVIRYKLADHDSTFCIISNSNSKYPRKESLFTFRKLASVNQNNFCNDLFSSLSPLHDRFTLACGNELSPNAFNDHFTQLISAVVDKHAPLQKASRGQKRIQRNPWLTIGILTSIKQKQKLYRTHFLNGDAFSINFFKTYSNKLTRVKTLSKKMCYNSTINKYKNKPKELWKFINSVIPNKHLKSLSIPKLINDGLVTDELTEIFEQFNNYFVKIGMTIANYVNKSDDMVISKLISSIPYRPQLF